MKLEIRDMTVKEAAKIVKKWHRHLPKIQGGLFATQSTRHGHDLHCWSFSFGLVVIVILRLRREERDLCRGVCPRG